MGNIHDEGLDRPESRAIYLPRLQDRFDGMPELFLRDVAFVVRSPRAGSAALLKDLQRAVWLIDSEIPLGNPTTVGELYTKSMARTSFTLVMLCVAGSMALPCCWGSSAYMASSPTPCLNARAKSAFAWLSAPSLRSLRRCLLSRDYG